MRWALTFVANRALALLALILILDAYGRSASCHGQETTVVRLTEAFRGLVQLAAAMR